MTDICKSCSGKVGRRLLPVFLKEVLVDCGHTHLLTLCLWLLDLQWLESHWKLSSCDKNHMSHKPPNIYYLALMGKGC